MAYECKIGNQILACRCFGFFLVGCAAHKVEDVKESGFLGDYSGFKKGTEDQLGLVYGKPGVNIKSYDKIMIDHVLVSLAPNSEATVIQPDQLAELANYFNKAIVNELKKDWQIVSEPGEGVLHLRTAITDIEPSNPTANTMSTIIPIGLAVSAVAKGTTDTNLGVGRASMEVELLDSVSGEKLAAAVDRREGGKRAFTGKWEDVQDAFDYWAGRFGKWLREQKNK